MTGYGVGEAPLANGRVAVEIRSLNHRYLEVRARLPTDLADQSLFVEQRCRRDLSRGRYDVVVRLEGQTRSANVDVERARSVYRELCKLRDELAPSSEVPISVLGGVPDLFTGAGAPDLASMREALGAALDAALGGLDEMRRTEGEALARELGGRLAAARAVVAKMSERVPTLVAQSAARLSERVTRLVSSAKVDIDQGRLETEIALLADKSDVTEELVRLESHFTQLESLFSSTESVGRKMDFLLQEITREANTCGAKCQDADLSHLVVELKTEVERMREQVQNVE